MKQSVDDRIADLAERFGYRLKTFDEDDANDLIAKDFSFRANRFLSAYITYPVPQYRSPVEIHFRFVEIKPSTYSVSHGLEAWTAPLFGSGKHAFVIFLSINLLRGISDVCTAMVVGAERLIAGVTEQDMEQRFEKEIYPRIAASLTFIFLHELAHIVRAHIPFFYQEKYNKHKQKEGLCFYLIQNSLLSEHPHSEAEKIRVHRSMEIDADLLAIGLVLQFVTTHKAGTPFLYEEAEMNDPQMFGEAIAVVTRLLEQWRRVVSQTTYSASETLHPHPDVRYVFFTAWLLTRERKEDHDEDFIRNATLFQKGFDAVQQKMETFGNQFFPLFEYLQTQGRDTYLGEYEQLRIDLDDYLRPRLKEFRVNDLDRNSI